jgi:hypothetical protein
VADVPIQSAGTGAPTWIQTTDGLMLFGLRSTTASCDQQQPDMRVLDMTLPRTVAGLRSERASHQLSMQQRRRSYEEAAAGRYDVCLPGHVVRVVGAAVTCSESLTQYLISAGARMGVDAGTISASKLRGRTHKICIGVANEPMCEATLFSVSSDGRTLILEQNYSGPQVTNGLLGGTNGSARLNGHTLLSRRICVYAQLRPSFSNGRHTRPTISELAFGPAAHSSAALDQRALGKGVQPVGSTCDNDGLQGNFPNGGAANIPPKMLRLGVDSPVTAIASHPRALCLGAGLANNRVVFFAPS